MRYQKTGQRTWLIVDGYNIIGAWPDLKEKAHFGLEDARESLRERLLDYCGFSGKQLLLVFDAYGTRRRLHCSWPIAEQEHQIVFTGQGQTADQFIERFVREHPKDRMIVVSNDQLVQVMVFSHAERMTARELFREMQQSKKALTARMEASVFRKGGMDERLGAEVAERLEQIRLGQVVYAPEPPKKRAVEKEVAADAGKVAKQPERKKRKRPARRGARRKGPKGGQGSA